MIEGNRSSLKDKKRRTNIQPITHEQGFSEE